MMVARKNVRKKKRVYSQLHAEYSDPRIEPHLGNKLKEFRQKAGLSVVELEKLSGVPAKEIALFEEGIISLSGGMLVLIAEALDLPPISFFDNEI